MKATVQEASAAVNAVHLLHKSDSFAIVEIDCATKYPQVFWTTSNGFGLVSNDPQAMPTEIAFEMPADWSLLCVEADRYTVTAAFGVRGSGVRPLWERS